MRGFAATCGSILLGSAICLSLSWPVCADAAPGAQAARSRPRIGLVLSGGGARGAAHVGVLRVLERMHIPVDAIAATSMGAVVGGLYASGMSADEMAEILDGSDWSRLLADRPPRAERSYRRKRDDDGFLVDFELGLGSDGLLLPRGIVQGQALTIALRRWLLPVATVDSFDRLPIRFRAVATDIANGREVVLDHGDLGAAIRASMSAPGVFAPVRIGDRLLVDGGLANNLPVAVAQSMGVDELIVVDVGFPLVGESELGSVLDVTGQMLSILIQGKVREQKLLMAPSDILIAPDLARIGSQAFNRAGDAMRAGEAAAQSASAALARLALAPTDYAHYRAKVRSARREAPVIDRVVIDNTAPLYPSRLEARLAGQIGRPLDVVRLEADIAELYGFDTFETIDYSLLAQDAGTELRVRTRAKTWGPWYLRFGVNLEDDFHGTSNYNLAARLTRTDLNALGGELRADLVIGQSPHLGLELHQPLAYGSRWFVSPALRVNQSRQGLYLRGHQSARYLNEDTVLSLGIGREFGKRAELRLSLARRFGYNEVEIGDPSLPGGSQATTSLSLDFGYDTIDRVAIPRHGTNVFATWIGARQGHGSPRSFDGYRLFVLKPHTWGDHTLLQWWDVGTAHTSDGAPIGAFSLGGLFSLSGYSRGELGGDRLAIGRLLYYRRLRGDPIPVLETPVYLGASLELGSIWNRQDPPRDLHLAGSVFVIFDTVLGPLYLAYGGNDAGRRSAYLFLGQTF